jgi:hypothetical protein
MWVDPVLTNGLLQATSVKQVIAWKKIKLPANENHENFKNQNTNLKQISMTEIKNSKQIE